MRDLFVRGIRLETSKDDSNYPFDIPAVKSIDKIKFTAPVTFLVGENGSGKSTIIESVAVSAGFNAEGGTKNYNFTTENTVSDLSNSIVLIRGSKRERYGYFLRAESFYTTANYAEKGTFLVPDAPSPIFFDGKRIHEQSHGEAFLSIIKSFKTGLFIFDEPESALSPQRILHIMVAMHELVRQGAQFIIATHSPLLLAYPGSTIYELTDKGVDEVTFQELDHVKLTRDFLNNPLLYLEKIFND